MPEAEATFECPKCQRTRREKQRIVCPLCAKVACTECVHRMGGRDFCSKTCATFFFFGDEDE